MPTGQCHLGPVRTSGRLRLMARIPITEAALIERYGPHLNEAPPGGWDAGLEIDKVVETHCCFCGQQCGIKLKVHDNEVVGFEPWYDFPFNEGKLCPKGVKRYLQGSHPDRLLHPMVRDESAPGGFRTVTWDEALSQVVERDPADPGHLRRRRLRHALGGLAHQREELPGRQVRPPRVCTPPTSTTTAATAWSPPASATRRPSGSTGPRTRGATSRSPMWSGSPARTSPRRSRSPPATSGGPATEGPSSSCRTPGSCPWPAPRTCSCRSDPAATRRCSVRCCTS